MSRPTTTGKVLEHYLEAHASCDLETVVDLFCDDAVLEDPAGSEPHVGRAAIRAFFAQVELDCLQHLNVQAPTVPVLVRAEACR